MPVEEWGEEGKTKGERRRRRRRSSLREPEEQKQSVPNEKSISQIETEEVTNQTPLTVILVMRQGIDEIRAELGE